MHQSVKELRHARSKGKQKTQRKPNKSNQKPQTNTPHKQTKNHSQASSLCSWWNRWNRWDENHTEWVNNWSKRNCCEAIRQSSRASMAKHYRVAYYCGWWAGSGKRPGKPNHKAKTTTKTPPSNPTKKPQPNKRKQHRAFCFWLDDYKMRKWSQHASCAQWGTDCFRLTVH